MKICCKVLCMIGFWMSGDFGAVAAEYLDGDFSGSLYNFHNDTIIADNRVMKADRINLFNSVTVENHGLIFGEIYLCDGCNAAIRNLGAIDGTVHVGNGAKFSQIISTNDDASYISVRGDYSVVVRDGDMVSLDKVFDISRDAGKISVMDSSLMLNAPINAPDGPAIKFYGENMIYVDDAVRFLGAPVIANATGIGAVHFHSENINPMYALTSYSVDGDIYLKIVRETDYSKILKNDVGDFLDMLRDEMPDDPLLNKMDLAADMGELNKIMSKSMRMNPIKLMDTVRILDAFETGFPPSVAGGPDIGAMSISMVADNFTAYGIRLGAGRVNGNLSVAIGAYAAVTDYSDDINEYTAEIYGANLRAVYHLDEVYFMHGIVGATVAGFDIGPVLDGNKIVRNPNGLDVYGAFDFAGRMGVGGGFSIVPFVGITADRASIGGADDFAVDGRTGVNAEYSFEMIGLRYDYAASFSVSSNGDLRGTFRIGILSVADAAGADIGIDVIGNEDGVSYKASVGGKFSF